MYIICMYDKAPSLHTCIYFLSLEWHYIYIRYIHLYIMKQLTLFLVAILNILDCVFCTL